MQFFYESRYLEATRIYRNYRTNEDEHGRPNPLLPRVQQEQTILSIVIDREGIKRRVSDWPAITCQLCDAFRIIYCPMAVPCLPCLCIRVYAATALVDEAVDAHTLILKETALYYRVEPYHERPLELNAVDFANNIHSGRTLK